MDDYQKPEPGQLYSQNWKLQVLDFTGLRYKHSTPTDFDAVLDFGGKAFVFLEIKRVRDNISTGQKIAYQHICMALRVPAIFIYATHDIPVLQEIPAADLVVRWFFFPTPESKRKGFIDRRDFHDNEPGWTVRDTIEVFLRTNKLTEWLEGPPESPQGDEVDGT